MIKELNEKELKDIQSSRESILFLRLRSMIESRFSVGDILIKKTYNHDLDDESENQENAFRYTDDESSMFAIRYLVVHVDSLSNLAFIKQFDEDGLLEDEIEPALDMSGIESGYMHFFEVDPAYVNACIVGEDFDIQEMFDLEKQRKEKHVQYRANNFKMFKDIESLHSFMDKLAPKQKLWLQGAYENDSWDMLSDYFDYEGVYVKSIIPEEVTVIKKNNKQAAKTIQSLNAKIKARMLVSLPKSNRSLSSLLKASMKEESEKSMSGLNVYTFSEGDSLSSMDLLTFGFFMSKPPILSENI